jgi:hypothetical protein
MGSVKCFFRSHGSGRVYFSKNEFRIKPLLGSVHFGIFIGVLHIYGTFIL